MYVHVQYIQRRIGGGKEQDAFEIFFFCFFFLQCLISIGVSRGQTSSGMPLEKTAFSELNFFF